MSKINYIVLLSILSSTLIFTSCDMEETEPTAQVYHGSVYIQCDPRPEYYFSLDSLIANCSSTDSFEVALPALQTCLYDSNSTLAGSPTDYDFRVYQNLQDAGIKNLSMADSSIQVVPISSIVLDANVFNAGTHPFYGGYRASWDDQTLDVYIFNRYVGGCLHDEVVWHLEVQ